MLPTGLLVSHIQLPFACSPDRSTRGWHCAYRLGPPVSVANQENAPTDKHTQTNLMEAILEFKFPLPRCVSLVAKISQHREPPWIFLTWFQCEPRPSIPYLIGMSHMPQISQDTEGHICLLSPELLLMESLLGFAFRMMKTLGR